MGMSAVMGGVHTAWRSMFGLACEGGCAWGRGVSEVWARCVGCGRVSEGLGCETWGWEARGMEWGRMMAVGVGIEWGVVGGEGEGEGA